MTHSLRTETSVASSGFLIGSWTPYLLALHVAATKSILSVDYNVPRAVEKTALLHFLFSCALFPSFFTHKITEQSVEHGQRKAAERFPLGIRNSEVRRPAVITPRLNHDGARTLFPNAL